MPLPRPAGLHKPTLDTPFHIDYGWWEHTGKDLRIYLLSHIGDETLREQISQSPEGTIVDYVHPATAEVFQVDALQLAIKEAASQPNFLDSEGSSVVDAIFRVFLSNNNQPLTPRELEALVHRPASVILKTIGGTVIYNGIRPFELA